MRMTFVQAGFGAGGAEKIIAMLAHHYQGQGADVDVVAVNERSSETYFTYGTGISVFSLAANRAYGDRSLRRWLGPASATPALRSHFVTRRPDVVFSFLTKVNVITAMAAAGLSIPIVMSERNNFTIQTMHPAWRAMKSVAQGRAARLVMQTEAARQALPRRLHAKATVIHNPVEQTKTIAVPGNPSHFVAVGRLDRQKGFDLLLAAFSIVQRKLPGARLTIFGEGQERGNLERAVAELGLSGSVTLPGITRSPQEWISAGGVFVLSSRFEGFPNVLLEALSAGLPSVCLACPWGPSEILADVADLALAAPNDVEDLAGKLLRIATDAHAREHLATRGPEIAARYSKDTIFAKWDAVAAAVTAPNEAQVEPVRDHVSAGL